LAFKPKLTQFTDWLGSKAWPRLIISGKGDRLSPISGGEKALVFSIAYAIALGLWLMVNLDREFSLELELDLATGNMADDRALASPIPSSVTVGVVGEGWKLLNLYNNPPVLLVDLESTPVNLLEEVKTLFAGNQDVNVTKVIPSILNASLEERLTRRVPVDLRLEMAFRRQFDIVGESMFSPDSVTISGARSRIEGIGSWPTEVMELTDVREDITVNVPLSSPSPVVTLSAEQVRFQARVAEFTEGELRIPVEATGLPRNRQITFIPASVEVRYSVPIDQYMISQEDAPFRVTVPFEYISRDTTGLVVPQAMVTPTDLEVRLRGIQPRSVSYFVIIQD
jgi:hypothetical protein